MLDNKGFDMWADGYDLSVGLSDDDNSYPFAGYKDVLGTICAGVAAKAPCRVLDIGFGTGVLTAKLYEAGCEVYGQDFSAGMIALARTRMPGAVLVQGDFSQGLAEELKRRRYDAIVATYSLHHLEDDMKVPFIRSLRELLNEGGELWIGDVAFSCHAELEACRNEYEEEWDDEEYYFVFDELFPLLPGLEFTKISHCAGVFRLARD